MSGVVISQNQYIEFLLSELFKSMSFSENDKAVVHRFFDEQKAKMPIVSGNMQPMTQQLAQPMAQPTVIDANKCEASTRKNQQCKKNKVQGSRFCATHGGGAPKPEMAQLPPQGVPSFGVSTSSISGGQAQAVLTSLAPHANLLTKPVTMDNSVPGTQPTGYMDVYQQKQQTVTNIVQSTNPVSDHTTSLFSQQSFSTERMTDVVAPTQAPTQTQTVDPFVQAPSQPVTNMFSQAPTNMFSQSVDPFGKTQAPSQHVDLTSDTHSVASNNSVEQPSM